jgi:predicted nucleic acid-binding protein
MWDNKTQKTTTNIHISSWIQAHDPSIQVIKTYASDQVATGTSSNTLKKEIEENIKFLVE